ncbi:fatty alcohol:caffeoyl-CoA acyltransferase [Cajanus cajan]|uniref:Taxadien-5-alpha-ol O-acetyltransferase n=1 Tax=Cajanus cajan TaxID=3821 RepID=A0A151TC61_CAJCA|nr:fatty alcohol:caffeoyl-CoA acyltransferase [Cajanus cajan]KYP64613.1 Taxadien-5-alpha-ol O-acetyltransferase [Cajanus cajan]
MLQSVDVPDCIYRGKPVTISPSAPTPKHSLYLSNLDDQKFLRFSIKYFYLFNKALSLDILKSSLARVLVDYYPLAGRLRNVDDHKLQLDCNGEGALFAEAFVDTTLHQLLEPSKTPNKSWKKFLYKVEAHTFVDVPPLVIQVTSLGCGGMILCTAISHCLCDGIGTSQFLHAWAELTRKPESDLTVVPFHWRHVLKPRDPAQVKFRHPSYSAPRPSPRPSPSPIPEVDLLRLIQSQTLVATSFTLTPSHLLCLKKQCVPSLKCTSFETLAAHTWRSWIRSLNQSLPPTLLVKLLFSVNVRGVLNLPKGYYGNGFVLACAESSVQELVGSNLRQAVRVVQEAKARVKSEEYVRSMVDLLEDKRVKTDLSTTFVISQWSKLGLEDLDFGEGKPLQMGPLTSDIYCLFLPVAGDAQSLRLLLSVPETMLDSFQYHMKQTSQK